MPSLPGYGTFRRAVRPYIDTMATGDGVLSGVRPRKDRRGVRIPIANDMLWRLGEHVTVYGMTGSGKTYLAKRMVKTAQFYNPSANVYILDTKHDDDDFKGWRTRIKSIGAPLVSNSAIGSMTIWQPMGTIDDTSRQINVWFRAILRTKLKSIVLVNDLKDIAPTPDKSPDGLAELLRDGRAFGISVIALTQEAAYVPRQVHNQITFAIRMLMNDSYDVAKVHRIMGGKRPPGMNLDDIPQPPKYGLYIARLDTAPRVIRYYDSADNLL